MSVIIRLQSLPWSANAMDIRRFFQGLIIPEGGVHIVGGELGDAFIAFGSDEDARQAMLMDGGKIKEARIKLLLSSRAEMQKVIDMARNQPLGLQPMLAMSQPVKPPMMEDLEHPRSPDLRNQDRRDLIRRDRRDRSRDGVRDKDRDRLRERRRRSKSRSRSPRRSRDKDRDRDVKRKDDRTRRPDDRIKREDGRKRDDLKDPQLNQNGNQLTPDRNTGMMDGSGMMVNLNTPLESRFVYNQGPMLGRNQEPWSEAFPNAISPWINQPEGLMPFRQQVETKDFQRPGADPFLSRNKYRWNREGEEPMELKKQDLNPIGLNDRIGKEAYPSFDSRSPDTFMPRGPMQERQRDMPYFPGSDGMNADVMELGSDRKPRESLMSGGRRGPFDLRGNRDGFPLEGRDSFAPDDRFAPLDGRDSESFRGNSRDSFGDHRPDPFLNDNSKDISLDRRPPLPGVTPRTTFIRPFTDGFSSDVKRNQMDSNGRLGALRPHATADLFDDSGTKRSRPGGGNCVELRGLPYSTTHKDIVDFLRGITISSCNVKLVGDERGSKVTSAVVRLLTESDRHEALKRNKQYMGNRYIEVFPCTDSYFESVDDVYLSSNGPDKRISADGMTCVLIKGLPFHCKEEEIHKLFLGLKLVYILMERDRVGELTGNAFVEFLSPSDAKQASVLKCKLGGKYLDVTLIAKERMLTARSISESKKDSHELDSKDKGSSSLRNTDCCILQGLPLNASDKDIVDFFSSVSVMPVTIHIMLTKMGDPSGDAFCEFKNSKDCEQALRKNSHYMKSRFIIVKPVSRSEMLDALGLVNQQTISGSRMEGPQSGRMPFDDRIMDRHSIDPPHERMPDDRLPLHDRRMLQDRFNPRDRMTPHDRVPPQGRHSIHDRASSVSRNTIQERSASGDRFAPHDRMPSDRHSMDRMGPDRMGMDRPPMDRMGMDRPPMDRHPLLDHPDRGGPEFGRHEWSDNVAEGMPRGLRGFGKPGCVLGAQNLPYRATIEDVLGFFKKYGITKENIIRRYNEKGLPTGDARIAFRSQAEAQEAARELNLKSLNGRAINVFLVYDN